MHSDPPVEGTRSGEFSRTSWNRLDTKRMSLTRPTPADLEDLCRMEQDPLTMEMRSGLVPRLPDCSVAPLL